MIRGATDVMESISPKTYTWVQILIAEGWLRYERCNPNRAAFLLHEMIASLFAIFTLVTQQPFGFMPFSLVMFHALGIALCWFLFHLCS